MAATIGMLLEDHCSIMSTLNAKIALPSQERLGKVMLMPFGTASKAPPAATVEREIVNVLTVSGASSGYDEVGGASNEKERIRKAWRLFLIYNTNAEKFKRTAQMLSYMLVVCNLATVIVSIADTNMQMFSAEWSEEHPYQSTFDQFTTLMPVICSFLLAMLHKFDPKMKWISLKFAAAQVEAEIYKYRLRVGKYERVHMEAKWWKLARQGQLNSTALHNAMQTMQGGHHEEARIKFGKQLKAIDRDLMDGAMSTSALAGKDHKHSLHDVEALGLKLAYNPRGTVDPTKPIGGNDSDVASVDPNRMILSIPSKASKGAKDRGSEKVLAANAGFEGERAADDGTSGMDVSVYVQCRLKSKLITMRRALPAKQRQYLLWQVIIYAFTVGGTFVASSGYGSWVPGTVAVAAAFKAINEYQALEQVLPITNNAIQSVEAMDMWWSSLSMVQKRDSEFAKVLVESTEDAILNEVGSWVAVMKTRDQTDVTVGAKNQEDENEGVASGVAPGGSAASDSSM